jgi:hypothetical protein
VVRIVGNFRHAEVRKVRPGVFVKVDVRRAKIAVQNVQGVQMGHPASNAIGDDNFLGIGECGAILEALGKRFDDLVGDKDKLGLVIFVQNVPANNWEDNGVLGVDLDECFAEEALCSPENLSGVGRAAVDRCSWIHPFEGHGNIHELFWEGIVVVVILGRHGAVMDGVEKTSGAKFLDWGGIDLKGRGGDSENALGQLVRH